MQHKQSPFKILAAERKTNLTIKLQTSTDGITRIQRTSIAIATTIEFQQIEEPSGKLEASNAHLAA